MTAAPREDSGMTVKPDAPDGHGRGEPPPGLVVVAIDRLPAWILPAYGSTWVAMPAVDGVAARGVVLDRLLATTDDPGHTLADLLGGRSDGGTGVGAAAAARGWRSALVTDDASVAAAAYATDVRHVPLAPHPVVAATVEETVLGRLCAAAAAVIGAGRHRLVVVHASSLGAVWDAPEEFRAAYVDPDDPPPPVGANVPEFAVTADTDPDLLVGVRQVFAGQLTLLDRCLAGVWSAAGVGVPPGPTQPTGWSIALAGLRGIGLGLHGRVGGGALPPFGELVHLPAILAAADGRMAGQRYGGLAVPADVGATLVEWLGGPSRRRDDEPWRGSSLAGLFGSWRATERDRVISTTAGGRAIATPAWHLVRPAADAEPARLFAKPDDFFELSDVADRCGAAAEELGGVLGAATEEGLQHAWRDPLSPSAVRGPA